MNLPAPPSPPLAPDAPMWTPHAEVIRAETEATRVRAEAGKAIVAVIFRSLVTLGVFGMAIGASAMILTTADRELHLVMLIIIWLSATIVGSASVLSGVLERRFVQARRLVGGKTVQLEITDAEKLVHAFQE